MKRVVLVTGGTMGIGLALAEAFLAAGNAVAVCGRSPDALQRFRESHPDALAVRADVTRAADTAALLHAVSERFGRLDVLVNNAGILVERDFLRDPDPAAGLDAEMAVNLAAPIRLTGEVLRRWPRIGALVFVTSGFALVSPSRAPTYGAAKAGLHGFAEGLRRQLARHGTHVLEVLPPAVDTTMTAGLDRRKMAPAVVAAATLRALARRRATALPGEVRFLPLLLRLAPASAGRLVGRL